MLHNKFYFKSLVVVLVFIFGIASWTNYKNQETISAKDTLSKSAIRFHVLANSDSTLDQQLKMQVKNAVVNYIYTQTKDFKTLEEAKNFISANDKTIMQVGANVIKSMGYSYTLTSRFGKETFPVKTYGDVTFPAGEYTSYTLSIGKGKGHNWWCVLYPPLCFVDASTGIVPDSSKERLQESLSRQEYQAVIKYRFKYLTFLNKYLP